MRKIEPEFITGMGYIGASPGVLYHMGGAGEQTVVTGNPVLLEGVKGNRFTSLTLHGISTQGSTTGAQLFDASLLGNTKSASVECSGSDIIITALEDGEYRQTSSVSIGFLEAGDQICIAAETFPKDNVVVIRDSDGGDIANVVLSNGLKKAVTIPANGTYRIILCINKGVPVKAGTVGVFSKLIVNKGNVSKDYEPYTGGKPSPSPEYPQEIENAGDVGEIALNVLGKNLLPFPYPGLGGAGTETEVKGVKYTVQSDGGIRCTGTVETRFGPTLSNIKFSDKPLSTLLVNSQTDGKIVLSGGTLFFDSNNNALFIYYRDSQVGKPLNIVIYPQVELGTVATEYEQYKPVQTLHIPTPNGLPGIPVSSGGNYTDEKGQQWVCDEVDFKKGVYVQRVAKEIPKTSFKVKETVDVEGRYSFTSAFKNIYKNGSNKCLISHGIYGNWGLEKNAWAITSTAFIYSPAERTTVDKIKEKILSLINSDNPLTFLGQLETPIEIPLTTEQLARYKALRTYSPTTTVINDAGAGMSAGYKRRK